MGQKKSAGKKGGGGAAALGARIFQKECTACHDGGNNTIESEKTLKADAFKKFGFNSVADVKKRVENGAGVMPVYKDVLKPNEIDAVANYVWNKSQKKGWK
ncbi:MAG: cytochrome c mono- and diheme variants family [bacterium]|nr:MAG: cytochrome c mono- and diheme variants family [bacterium]